MEAIEESPLQNVTAEATKVNATTCEESTRVETPVQSNVCHKPNGVSDSKDTEQVQPSLDATVIPSEEQASNTVAAEEVITETIISDQESVAAESVVEEATTAVEDVLKDVPIAEEQNLGETKIKIDQSEDIHTEQQVEIDGIVETMPENVRFETEILIETNIDDQPNKCNIVYEDDSEQPDHTNNILNELGQNIELSEVLRSSDVSENLENNNCDVTQEVFNKEELLDILEGNDMEESRKVNSENFVADCKSLETQLALQQLSRLKQTRKYKSRSTPKKVDKKTSTSKKIDSPKEEIVKKRSSRQKEDSTQANSSAISEGKEESLRKKSSKQKDENQSSSSDASPELSEDSVKKKGGKQKDDSSQSNTDATPELGEESVKKKSSRQKDDNVPTNSELTAESTVEPKKESIVNALVKDWDDEPSDEPSDADQAKKLIEESDKLLVESEELVKSQEDTVTESKTSDADPSAEDEQAPNLNNSESETQPQRRLGRVIKKKVIFDPDNPDTFTKSKTVVKKDHQSEKDQKDQPTPKKIKTDQISPRSKSKSPVQSKLQWKKPQPKNIKPSHKRLTEIDRLLMDEGAVNMICQLTPEAPQGNKNMKSKAEFIKKIQSSTPEGKEMKFRERIKKESKSEESDARRISSKDRLSMSCSVKSPSASEDFEAHSADDSIIYRRHSSSSYSSPCMSPRRLSDVESINQNASATVQQAASYGGKAQQQVSTPAEPEAFMAGSPSTVPTTIINKTDFLSMKEKLNSKLSQALNKRKRESTKPEKPMKVKKVSKNDKVPVAGEHKYVKLSTDQRLAEICIRDAGTIFNVEVMNELKTVLESLDSRSDISVTFLRAESGTLCSGLELSPILDHEKGVNYALELAESARALLSALEIHSKLVCTVVEDRCHGLGLSLVALSDVAVASENAIFELTSFKGAPLLPGAAVLTTRGLSQSLLNELILLERRVSGAEAVRGGLAARAVWPPRAQEEARAVAADIAAQPHENIMLKKQLLRLKRGSSEAFVTSLQLERDLFVNYWVSEEGRELVRASLRAARE